MATLTALLDACVLYPQTLRDLLLNLARTDLFRARWTDLIGEILELGQVSSLRSHLNSRTGRDRQKKPRAVVLAEHPRIEDHDHPTIGLRPDQPANTLLEFQDGFRHLVLVEPISSSPCDLFEPCFQEWMAWGLKGSLVMMTFERAEPGTSTPCQKVSVPKRTLSTSVLNFSRSL